MILSGLLLLSLINLSYSADDQNDEVPQILFIRPPQPPLTNPCLCMSEYEPVCGSDNQTYTNICLLNCVPNVFKLNDGACIPPKPSITQLPILYVDITVPSNRGDIDLKTNKDNNLRTKKDNDFRPHRDNHFRSDKNNDFRSNRNNYFRSHRDNEKDERH